MAVASALTKYDDLDAIFSKGKKAGPKEMVQRLVEEVMGEEELIPTEEERRSKAEREVRGDVSRYVSEAYQLWVKKTAK
eukprot:3938868-Rhodomonas_salina.1